MFSATFLITYAEGLAEDKVQELVGRLEADAAALSDVYVLGDVLNEPAATNGNILFEIGFADQEAYEAAKETPEWADIKEAVADTSLVASYEFAAYGDSEGNLKVTETDNGTGHRVLFVSVDPTATEEAVAHALEKQPFMQDFVPGFLNSKLTAVVESEGRERWDYVFECDYADPSVYFAAYMMHPIHITYVDRFFEPACKEQVFISDLCTSLTEVEKPFLANYAE